MNNCENCHDKESKFTEPPCVGCQSYDAEKKVTLYLKWRPPMTSVMSNLVPVERAHAFEAVTVERLFQDGKWGTIYDHGHTIGEWLIIAQFELNEAMLALVKGGAGRDSVRSEIIQTIAVLTACLEQHSTIEPTTLRQI